MTSLADIHNPARSKRIARELALSIGLAGLTAVSAKVAIFLPWTPVPATLQVAAVIFAGSACGAHRGFFSQALYVLLGISGLPVFAEPLLAGPAMVMQPTFGYVLAFPAAAFLAGHDLTRGGRWVSALLALGVIYGMGLLWLLGYAWYMGTGATIGWALYAGILPFLPFDLLKMILAVWSGTPIYKRMGNA
jgi:biotin transport system substrate-specific component